MMDKKLKEQKNTGKINVLSLFSGCGGMDLGFEGDFLVHKDSVGESLCNEVTPDADAKEWVRLPRSNFNIVFANDILKEAKATWLNNFVKRGYSPNIFHSDSIVNLVKSHQAGIPIFPDNVDIVTGGFPCQDFSVAGKRNGFQSHKDHNGQIIEGDIATEETRGKLYMWMKEVIDITKPKIFVAENVKGLVNLANVKDIIQHDFSTSDGNGYIVLNPQVLHAADYGVPQSRERVIFIGIRKSSLSPAALDILTQAVIPSEYDPYPKPTHHYSKKSTGHNRPQSLRNIFSILTEPLYSEDPSQKYHSKAKFMGKHCQGQIEVNLDGIAPTIRAEHHGNIEFRRLGLSNGGKYTEELKIGLAERRLTPRECGLIQSFPPDFDFVIPTRSSSKFIVSPSGAYKVIGNAVPPLLAYHIGQRIERVWPLYFN